MLLSGLRFLGAAEPELDDMMLQSPLTSTPFSVKDILKLEQQQHQSATLELQHRPHAQLATSPPSQQQHFQAPPSCMLAHRDSPSFSEGEDNLAYLSALAAREEDRGEPSLSPDMYVHPGLQGAKLDTTELEEPDSSEWTPPHTHPPPDRGQRRQGHRDSSRGGHGFPLIRGAHLAGTNESSFKIKQPPAFLLWDVSIFGVDDCRVRIVRTS